MRERLSAGPAKVLRFFILLVIGLGTVVAIGSLFLGDRDGFARLFPLLVLVSVLSFGFPKLTGWIHAWSVGRSDPAVGYPLTHSWDETGVHISTAVANIELKWTGLHKIRETPDMFMFYYSTRLAYYLPKRAIPQTDEIPAPGEWLRERLPAGTEYVQATHG